MNDENKKLTALMKTLEGPAVGGVQSLQKATTNRFQVLEELIKTDKKRIQTQMEDIREVSTSPLPWRIRDELPGFVSTPAMSYPITNYGRQANKNYSEGYTDWKWESTHVKDLNNIKEAGVAYGMLSAYVTTCAPRRVWEHSFANERTKQVFSVEHNLSVQQASEIP